MRSCVLIQQQGHCQSSHARGIPSIEAKVLEMAAEIGGEWSIDSAGFLGPRLADKISRMPGTTVNRIDVSGPIGITKDSRYREVIAPCNLVIFVLMEPPRLMFQRLIVHAKGARSPSKGPHVHRVLILRSWTERMEDSSDDR